MPGTWWNSGSSSGLPVWRYGFAGVEIEKRILMPHGQNTVHVRYRLVRGNRPVRLTLRPSVHFRSYESPVNASAALVYSVTAREHRYEVCATNEWPTLRMMMYGSGAALTLDAKGHAEVPYAMEALRGYEAVGSLWSPGILPRRPAAGGDGNTRRLQRVVGRPGGTSSC